MPRRRYLPHQYVNAYFWYFTIFHYASSFLMLSPVCLELSTLIAHWYQEPWVDDTLFSLHIAYWCMGFLSVSHGQRPLPLWWIWYGHNTAAKSHNAHIKYSTRGWDYRLPQIVVIGREYHTFWKVLAYHSFIFIWQVLFSPLASACWFSDWCFRQAFLIRIKYILMFLEQGFRKFLSYRRFHLINNIFAI